MSIACLPWYELPETRAAQDALWQATARQLRRCGMRGVPGRLSRGIPVMRLLSDPRLLLGQCCGYDVTYGFPSILKPVATPCYAAPGCDGTDYSSFVLVRDDNTASGLNDLRGGVCVVNSFASHSGTNALRHLVAPLSRGGRFFRQVIASGAHLDSLSVLKAGMADVMAMDCVTHALLMRYRPDALAGARILCQSAPAPAPPLVTAASTDREVVALLRAVLREIFVDQTTEEARASLLLNGIRRVPLQEYERIVQLEASALGHGYFELHATSSAIASAGRATDSPPLMAPWLGGAQLKERSDDTRRHVP